MKQAATLALVSLAGFALGAGAIRGLHAQAGKAPAYAVAEIEVTDPPVKALFVYASNPAASVPAVSCARAGETSRLT